MFFITEKSQETTFEFTQNAVTVVWFLTIYEMETQKFVNLLGATDNEFPKFATRTWYVKIMTNNTEYDQSNTEYGKRKENDSSIKFEKKVIKANLFNFSDAYILVKGNIAATHSEKLRPRTS